MKSINSLLPISSTHNSPPFLLLPPISPPIRRRHTTVSITASSQFAEPADNNNNNKNKNKYYDYASGKLVDESMIVLRKRIHEMKMAEQRQDPPADWLEWEKRYYSSYDSHICEALGYLQSHLMNTRPSVVFGILLLLTLSLPLSSAVLLHYFLHLSATLLAALRPS